MLQSKNDKGFTKSCFTKKRWMTLQNKYRRCFSAVTVKFNIVLQKPVIKKTRRHLCTKWSHKYSVVVMVSLHAAESHAGWLELFKRLRELLLNHRQSYSGSGSDFVTHRKCIICYRRSSFKRFSSKLSQQYELPLGRHLFISTFRFCNRLHFKRFNLVLVNVPYVQQYNYMTDMLSYAMILLKNYGRYL